MHTLFFCLKTSDTLAENVTATSLVPFFFILFYFINLRLYVEDATSKGDLRARGNKVLQPGQLGSKTARENRIDFALADQCLQVTCRCSQRRKTCRGRWLLAPLILQVEDSVATKAWGIKTFHSPAESRPKAPRVVCRYHFTTLHFLNVLNKMACRDGDTALRKLRVSSVLTKHRLQRVIANRDSVNARWWK